MGADLILSYVVVPEAGLGRVDKLDWEAGRKAIDKTSESDLKDAWYEIEQDDEAEDTLEELREKTVGLFNTLQDIVTGGYRDVTCLTVRGATVVISGGMSWGDMPTESSETLSNVWNFLHVLKAIGFETGYDDRPPDPEAVQQAIQSIEKEKV